MECSGQSRVADPADVLFECTNMLDSVEALTNYNFGCQDGGRVESNDSKPPAAEHQQTIGGVSKSSSITSLHGAKEHPVDGEKINDPI